MVAVKDSKRISIGRDFVGAVTDKPVWIVSAGGYRFEVVFECSGDDAVNHVRDVFKSEHKSIPASFQFQRA